MMSTMTMSARDIRSGVLKSFLAQLVERQINYIALRGYENIFCALDKDVDLMVEPENFGRVSSLFKQVTASHQGAEIANVVRGKSLYLKALFVGSDSETIEGLYIHCVGFVTLKTGALGRNFPWTGRHAWLSDFESVPAKVDSATVMLPPARVRALFALAKLVQRPEASRAAEVGALVRRNGLDGWAVAIDPKEAISKVANSGPFEGASRRLTDVLESCSRDLLPRRRPIRLKQYCFLLWRNLAEIPRLKGKLIFFSGPDGSGKTTTNMALSSALRDKLKVRVENRKALYPLSQRLHGRLSRVQAKIRKLDPADSHSLERDRGNTRSWKLRRLAGLLFLLMQVWPGYALARLKNLLGHTVIVDTSFFDVFIKGHRPSFPWLQKISVPLLPSGDHWFLMVAEPSVIVARKPELTESELIEYYDFFARIDRPEGRRAIPVNTTRGVDAALADIVRALGAQ